MGRCVVILIAVFFAVLYNLSPLPHLLEEFPPFVLWCVNSRLPPFL